MPEVEGTPADPFRGVGRDADISEIIDPWLKPAWAMGGACAPQSLRKSLSHPKQGSGRWCLRPSPFRSDTWKVTIVGYAFR